MWVSSLEIHNIKSFAGTVAIRLDKKMNILLGANNSGKSTILRALYQMQNPASLTGSDIRIGTDTGRVYIHLEDTDNTYIANWIQNGYIPGIYLEGTRAASNVSVTMKNHDNTSQVVISIPARERYNFIYPYLSNRKVSGYRRD